MNSLELFRAVGNTLLIVILSSCVALPVGFALGVLLIRSNIWLRRIAWMALGSQIAVPLYVFAGGWSACFGLQGWLTSFGFRFPQILSDGQPGTWGAFLAVVCIYAFAGIPWVALLTAVGLRFCDRGQEEQALLDGGVKGLVWYSILPNLNLWLWAAWLWISTPVLTEMVVSNLFQVPTVAELVYLDVSQGTTSLLTYVAAFVLCTAPLALVGWWLLRTFPSWQDLNLKSKEHLGANILLQQHRVWLSTLVWTVLLFLVGLPIASLISKAGWQASVDAAGRTTYGWSLERLGTTAVESLTVFQAEFQWSGLLAACSSSVALGVAGLLYFLPRVFHYFIHCVMLAMLAVPGPMVGMLVIWMMNRSNPAWLGSLYDNTLSAPILAQQFRLLPVAWLLVNTVLRTISRDSWEQAQLDQLTGWQKLQTIVIPQTGRLWLCSLLLIAVFSIGELSCTILVLPPGVTTVSMRLFEMLHFGMRHQDSGLCGALILLGWVTAFAIGRTLRDR